MVCYGALGLHTCINEKELEVIRFENTGVKKRVRSVRDHMLTQNVGRARMLWCGEDWDVLVMIESELMVERHRGMAVLFIYSTILSRGGGHHTLRKTS